MNREQKILDQIEMQNQIVVSAKINLVNCGHCGSVMFHRINEDLIECPFCDFKSEPCDFPDYFYEGLEISKQFEG
jgi:hypothetical protein